MDPYKVLGVTEDTDQKTIKKAYRKLAGQHHPDRGGDAEKFKEVAEAYSILSDEQKRQQYHANQRRGHFGMGFEDIFGRGFPFEEFFAQKPQRTQQVKKNTEDSEIQFNLRINLEQIKRGASQEISFKRNIVCTDCHGSGGGGRKLCGGCGGTGTQTVKPAPFFIQHIPCRACRGAGILFDSPCGKCGTHGLLQVQERVVVKIEEDKEK
jgi:molecular chaperone DnaJ